MAKLPALVSVLAARDERDRATLEHIARVIREDGKIPTTKRGSGAADMTVESAVNLFLAVNGSNSPKDAPLAIERFRSLKLRPMTVMAPEDDVFTSIVEAENFGIALERLIEGMPQLILNFVHFLYAGYAQHEGLRDLHIEQLATGMSWSHAPLKFMLRLHRHSYRAEISIETWVGKGVQDAHWRTEFYAEYVVDADRHFAGFYGPSKDRQTTVTVSAKALYDLWEVMLDDEERESATPAS